MTTLSKRSNINDITFNNERSALKKVKGKPAPKTDKKDKDKVKTDDNIKPIKKKS
jgi:hypothetical protein